MLSMATGVGVRIVSNYKGTCRLTGAFFLCYNINIKSYIELTKVNNVC